MKMGEAVLPSMVCSAVLLWGEKADHCSMYVFQMRTVIRAGKPQYFCCTVSIQDE